MANIKVKTQNQVKIEKKQRVYFCCHPEDFQNCFDRICSDIFKTHDPAIYYTEDMTEEIPEDEKEVVLLRNNLFVIPITYKLLTTENRAMMVDIPYAIENHKTILPIMMEQGIENLYSKPFGSAQFLDAVSDDATEIPYEEKLKKFLEAVLVSDELASRIRSAFSAYIFLSYRKKDRKYANELMRIIHKKPEFQDVAIWFDEFLTPGENWGETIDKALSESKLMTLLVTPNLLEKPNFVLQEEYPKALKASIPIIPAIMVKTDEKKLKEEFSGLPDCLNPKTEEFTKQIERLLEGKTKEINDRAEHNYLIGRAYLDGIDVEVDGTRGLELITRSAEMDNIEALFQLVKIYNNGIGVKRDYKKALTWAEKYYNSTVKKFGAEDKKSISALAVLSESYRNIGNYKKALELRKKAYSLQCRVYGDTSAKSLGSLNDNASTLSAMGEYKKALELAQKAYTLHLKKFGEEGYQTIVSLNNLCFIYSKTGNYKKALELAEKGYEINKRLYGEEHKYTLTSLKSMGNANINLGNYQKALEQLLRVYKINLKNKGDNHPDTFYAENSLASAYRNLGKNRTALKHLWAVYEKERQILGEKHPSTLDTLYAIGLAYKKLNRFKKALEFALLTYESRLEVLGEKHPLTLSSLSLVSGIYLELGEKEKFFEITKKVYNHTRLILGENHPDTLIELNNLALAYKEMGDIDKAHKMNQKAYNLRKAILGEDHPDTLESLVNLSQTSKTEEALYLCALSWQKRRDTLGKKHPETIDALTFFGNTLKSNPKKCIKTISGMIKETQELRQKLGENNPKAMEFQNKTDLIVDCTFEALKNTGRIIHKHNIFIHFKRLIKK